MKMPYQALAAAALLIVTLGSTKTFAVDAKNYPGSTCQPSSGPADALQYSLGVVSNSSSTDSIVLDCPIIKDVLNTPLSRGRIAVIAQNPNEAVLCTIRSIEAPNGADFPSRVFTQLVSTPGTDRGAQYLNFASLTDFGNDSYYAMTCRLPPSFLENDVQRQSGIIFYQIREEE